MHARFDRKLVSLIKKGGIGVLPTDTLYGIVGSALDKNAVEKIYALRKRDRTKPMIVLISAQKDLRTFGIRILPKTAKLLKSLWPGPVSIILPCASKKFTYLHRGKKSIAFRVPASTALRMFLQKTGPLVAPSANEARKTPATTITQARKYFGNAVDFYIPGPRKKTFPSTLISLAGDKIFIVREGAGVIPPISWG